MNGRVVTEMGKANVKESEKAYTMELAAPGRGRHPDRHHAEDRTEAVFMWRKLLKRFSFCVI